MGFKKTSEGRVFFKSANNDDIPAPTITPPPEAAITKDSTHAQILLLLKTLNDKLQESRDDNAVMKKTLDDYKAKIDSLESRTLKQQSDYVDLEQKVSEKQQEVSKKASRVEGSVKATLKQLEEARTLVKALEEKSETHNYVLAKIKGSIEEKSEERAKEAEKLSQTQKQLLAKHKALEERQKEQSEKVEKNLSSYTALSKRIGEAETRQDTLDNKIEEATSQYIKLDRKIDRVIEDRNRIIRKIERIESAVIETRDALNAKAMVLLTDQGASGATDINIHDQIRASLSNDPMVRRRQIEEGIVMPWWRRPVRIQATSLILLLGVVMLLGWIISAANSPIRDALLDSDTTPPTISLGSSDSSSQRFYAGDSPSQETLYEAYEAPEYDNAGSAMYGERSYGLDRDAEPDFSVRYDDTSENALSQRPVAREDSAQADTSQQDNNASEGITVHRGYDDPTQIHRQEDIAQEEENEAPLDISDDEQMLAAMGSDPERVARRLNQIEPGSLKESDTGAAQTSAPPAQARTRVSEPQPSLKRPVVSESYKASLRRRIRPDSNLSAVVKKIEVKAFEGVPEAQHDLGAIYIAGRGSIRQNLERAVFWFQEAANNGVANAKYNLGVLYHQGMGVPANLDKAIQLYTEAADLGHAEAQYNLGIANIEGIGLPYNPGNAARYFERAAHQGVVEAAYNLGLIYENGLLGEVKPDIALTWYKHAADAGSPEAKAAMQQLANSLGVGVDDITRIIENVERSHTSFSSASDRQSLIARTQDELMRRGLYPGPVDGMLGPMTRRAIEGFQRAANLRVDGEPSVELLQYLKASTNSSQYQ
ncbi:MAG: peptidoglycan-binding protein [Alphaproteobacteria bacterium]